MLKLANIRQGQTIYRVYQNEDGKVDIMTIFVEGVVKYHSNKDVLFIKTKLSASGYGDVGNHNRHNFFPTLNKAKRFLEDYKRVMLNLAKEQGARGTEEQDLPSDMKEKDLIMISVDENAEEFMRKGFEESWLTNAQLDELITGKVKSFVYGEQQLVLEGSTLLLKLVDTSTNELVDGSVA